MSKGVSITALAKKFNLRNLTNQINTDKIKLLTPDINRPALQLSGFYEYFDHDRVQIIGNVEMGYLDSLSEEEKHFTLERLVEHEIPCIIFSRNREPEQRFIDLAAKNGVPILVSAQTTSDLMAEVIRWLNVELLQQFRFTVY